MLGEDASGDRDASDGSEAATEAYELRGRRMQECMAEEALRPEVVGCSACEGMIDSWGTAQSVWALQRVFLHALSPDG